MRGTVTKTTWDALDHQGAVFADLEFTRLMLPSESPVEWLRRVRVLSIGLAAATGRGDAYFVRDLSASDRAVSSEFVREVVLPILDQGPVNGRFGSTEELRAMLATRFKDSGWRTVIVDYLGDALLLDDLLPAHVSIQIVDADHDEGDGFFTAERPSHHALADAQHLRHLRAALLEDPAAAGD